MKDNKGMLPPRIEEIANNLNDTYYYIKAVAKYYRKEKNKFFRPMDIAHNLMCTWKELNWLRSNDIIKTYDDLCYYKWGKTGCYNLLDESKILKPSESESPKIDKMIKLLIENVCWYKEENIEYLHKTILYKYHNLNDFTVPAIVFYWAWWSWKWSFITLLSTIFWEQNVMANLWQRDISWSFDTYKW